ncbi:MAG TPA: bifunctional riboflavin kinase/FAD synthetase [Candidatus Limnocylindrales bacterium]|nr:bifunctional riboflavin kinase/FAD synthetase [Candidatus Limnocylindrales bacterium]
MIHLTELEAIALTRPSVVTIGVFDGVHLGHQYLVRRLVASARASGRLAVVITFYPHPDVVLRGITGRYYLTTPDERAALLGDLGVDFVVTLSFDDHLRHIRAAAFVDLMVNHLRVSELWVGAEFALGYKREGNVPFLTAQGAEKGFVVDAVDLMAVEDSGDGLLKISSSAIRAALAEGAVETAERMLGRPYGVRGEIVHGLARGRTIGFPTANIAVPDERLIPANGVYAGWALLDSECFMAVTNVGTRPTFSGEDVTVEAHLLDFNRDIYGAPLEFQFITRLRPEMRFTGIEALIAQIEADAAAGRAVLADRG